MQIRLIVQVVRDPAVPRRRPGRAFVAVALAALALFVPVAVASDVFSDVPSTHPFHDQIDRTYAAGMIGGCGATTFCPGNTVTKGMAANQYDKAFGLDGVPRPFTPTWRKVNIVTGGSTPPFAVDSTQKVANLNADRLDGQDASAFTYGAGAGLSLSGNQFSVAGGGISPSMMQAFPSARVYSSSNQGLSPYYEDHVIFDSEQWDTGGLHSNTTNNSRLTAPIDGLYELSADIAIAGSNTGTRNVTLVVNGATRIAASLEPGAFDTQDVSVSTLWRLAAGDYVEVYAYQSTINAAPIVSVPPRSPSFAMAWLGP